MQLYGDRGIINIICDGVSASGKCPQREGSIEQMRQTVQISIFSCHLLRMQTKVLYGSFRGLKTNKQKITFLKNKMAQAQCFRKGWRAPKETGEVKIKLVLMTSLDREDGQTDRETLFRPGRAKQAIYRMAVPL